MLGIAAVLEHDVAAANHRLKPFAAGLVSRPAAGAQGCPLCDALKHIPVCGEHAYWRTSTMHLVCSLRAVCTLP